MRNIKNGQLRLGMTSLSHSGYANTIAYIYSTSVETVSWKRSGEWTYPDGTVNSKENQAKCLKEIIDENSTTTTESATEPTLEPTSQTISKPVIKLCEDLNGDLFDETVDVSFRFQIVICADFFLIQVTCAPDNSVCTFTCIVGSVVKPTIY